MFGEYIGTLALALLFILAMFGWGSLFLKLFPGYDGPFFNDLASRIVAGCGILYIGFVGLGAMSQLHRLQVGILLVAGLLVSCYFITSFVNNADLLKEWKLWKPADRIFAASIGLLVVLQIIFALTPLIFYDLQVYHLLAPAQFLKTGNLAHIPWNMQTNSPLALQLTVGMSLILNGSGQVAKLLLSIFGCLISAGIYELIRPSGRRAALIAALFVLCFPEFWTMQMLGVVDMPIAGFMMFGAVWLRQGLKDGQWRPAILSGIAFGIAVGSRYQAVVLTALIVALILAEHLLTASPLAIRRTLRQLCMTGSLMFLLVCPWLIRNYAHVGNPVYPLMQARWGGSEWSAAQDSQLRVEALGPQLGTVSITQKLISPVLLLFASPSNIWLGLILLIGSLIALASPRSELRMTAILGLAGLFAWGLIRPSAGVPLLRYNVASLVFLLAATGAVLGSERISAKYGSVVAALLAAGLFVVGMIHVQRVIPATQALVNPELWETLRRLNVPAWGAMEYANENLDPVHDKILLIGETRGFWLQIPFIAPSSFNGPQLDEIFGKDSDTNSRKQRLVQLGISHLMISYPEFQRLHRQYVYLNLPPAGMEAFNRWIQGLPKVFEDGRGTVVLELRGH